MNRNGGLTKGAPVWLLLFDAVLGDDEGLGVAVSHESNFFGASGIATNNQECTCTKP